MSYFEILEALDSLSIEDQEDIAELIKKRTIEKKREILARDIDESFKEYESGLLKPQTVEEIMMDLTK